MCLQSLCHSKWLFYTLCLCMQGLVSWWCALPRLCVWVVLYSPVWCSHQGGLLTVQKPSRAALAPLQRSHCSLQSHQLNQPSIMCCVFAFYFENTYYFLYTVQYTFTNLVYKNSMTLSMVQSSFPVPKLNCSSMFMNNTDIKSMYCVVNMLSGFSVQLNWFAKIGASYKRMATPSPT